MAVRFQNCHHQSENRFSPQKKSELCECNRVKNRYTRRILTQNSKLAQYIIYYQALWCKLCDILCKVCSFTRYIHFPEYTTPELADIGVLLKQPADR